MIDINLIRTNPDLVKDNIRKKFQDHKLEYVDKVLALDEQIRNLKKEGDGLRAARNTLSSQIGLLMREKKIDESAAQIVLLIHPAGRFADRGMHRGDEESRRRFPSHECSIWTGMQKDPPEHGQWRACTGETDRFLAYLYRPGIPGDRFFLVDFSDLQPSAYHIASLFCVSITSYPNCGFCQGYF